MSNKKKVNKREVSAIKYVDTIFTQHSKVCALRTDLAYAKDENGKVDISLEEANRDLRHMLNNKRGKPSIYGTEIGYILKKEYTEDKGVHFHLLSLHNGNKVQNDYYKAKQIGEYWEKITNGRGVYHNCNQNKKKYEELGIGIIDHKDTDKRKILNENVIHYLCKDDHQDIAPIKSGNKDRAFVRGTLPKKKSNAGRPRN